MPTLEFKGKQFVYAHHLSVPFRQLNLNEGKSLPAKGTKPALDDNLVIHGDNLHALKALLPRYAGKIKCIYIDPPYNTGNEGWCYNDKVNSPLMKEWLKKSANPVDKEDLERHDKWCSMMWPRIQLLKELLSEDGVIFISIDANELHHLVSILEEIFGIEQHVGTLTWYKKRKASFLSTEFITVTESIVCFKKDSGKLKLFGGLPDENESQPLVKRTNSPSTLTFTAGVVETKLKNGKYLTGTYGEGSSSVELLNDIEVADGIIQTDFTLKGPFVWSQEMLLKELSAGGQVVINTINFQPRAFRPLGERHKGLGSFIDGREFQATTDDAYENLQEIFQEERVFEYSKPWKLVKRLIQAATYFDPNSIILDSFAGSGTTAHATLALNKEDDGNRKFILVECEEYADKITAERVRRVIQGVPNAKDAQLKAGLDGSFAYCDLGQEINIENLLKGENLPSYDELAGYAFYTATGQTLDKPQHGADYFIGETENYRVHVIYKPEVEFLRSGESALNMPLAESIAKSVADTKKTALVFATHKFMGQKELTEMGITYCQLPYAIHRMMGE